MRAVEPLVLLRDVVEARLVEVQAERDAAAAELERAEQLRGEAARILDRARAGLDEAQKRVYALVQALDALEDLQHPQEPPAPAQGQDEPGETIDPAGVFVEVEQ